MIKKECNKCGKQTSDFKPDIRNKDGLQGICNECQREYKRASRAKRLAGENIVSVESKTCNKCQETKLIDQFFKDSGIADGHATICKECKYLSQEAWRENNRDQYNSKMRAYNKKHKKKLRLQRYKITPEQHEAMMVAQGGKCKLCRKVPSCTRPLAVDHCHETGRVRGLLCYGCNRLIVALDKHPLHDAMIEYLKS